MKTDEIIKSAEALFGERVEKIMAPGGKKRGSYRVQLQTQTVIVSQRGNKAQTDYEAMVLKEIQAHTDASAKFLGMDDGLMYQSDVGATRISQLAHEGDTATREDLAVRAVRGLFSIHAAGRAANLAAKTHQLGATPAWVESFVKDVEYVPRRLGFEAVDYDKSGLAEFIGTPALQFVKWDCRGGNAAVDDAGVIRWFDFEYSGVRHGAEDFAWLIGDECWPVPAETMVAIVAQEYDGAEHREWDGYCAYLEVYSTLHAVQRVIQILNAVKRKGWISKQNALHYDKIGINPHFAIQLCQNGAYLAGRNKITAPLADMFDRARLAFESTLQKI